jgi:hypothetical protein
VLDVFAFEVLDVPHPAAVAITAALVSAINTLRIAMTRPFSVRGYFPNGSTAIGIDAVGLTPIARFVVTLVIVTSTADSPLPTVACRSSSSRQVPQPLLRRSMRRP